MGYAKELFPAVIQYHLARMGIMNPANPINVTFSVTNICQSRCKTCQIWDLYRKNPEKRKEELTLEEIKKIFRSMGHIYIFNVSGGEPFLRSDITEIIDSACRYLQPGIIHIPTNAIALELIEKKVKEILEVVGKWNNRIQVTIKPSLDHIGENHDQIRGVPGNFKKVIETFNRLKALQQQYPFLHVELGTVISAWNAKDMDKITRFVAELRPDSYRNEIAEIRSEMFNMKDNISPDPEQYKRAVGLFSSQASKNMKNNSLFQKITNSFRLTYYDLAVSILKEKRQVIPCYAGISNVHMSPYGDIWPCCTLGYEMSMGNVREYNYDFHTVWNSKKADKIRGYIKRGKCYCPLANQAYSNILMHGKSVFSVVRGLV